MFARGTAARLLALLPVMALVIAGSTLLGPGGVGLPALEGDGRAEWAYWHLRVPRTLLGAAAGAGLAIGGVIFQALFRNPLATPYTLGVASGASLAAAIGFLLGVGGTLAGVPRLALLAFGGALAALGAVFLMSKLRGGRDMTRLLLAGVCVAYLCTAGLLLGTYLADRAVTNEIVLWMMGSLGALRPRAAAEVAVVLVPVLAYGLYAHRALDLLTLGDRVAATRGVAVDATIWTCLTLVGVLTAIIVANCGPIGFVGLMVPHIGRALFGVRTFPLLLGSALLGAGFLAVCDGVARSLPNVELPVGVVTNILGAVFFFFLLATRDVLHGVARG